MVQSVSVVLLREAALTVKEDNAAIAILQIHSNHKYNNKWQTKDPYTAGHSLRVSDMALRVCELMGLKKEDAEKVHIAAHFHDIGKIGVPDAVLNKEGRLTERVILQGRQAWKYR